MHPFVYLEMMPRQYFLDPARIFSSTTLRRVEIPKKSVEIEKIIL